MIQLYQFPFSHFCEKARWALDYKGLAYRVVNLLPGFHLKRMRKIAPKTCLPVLVADGTVVQDSTAIIDYLDLKFPDPGLTPRNPEAVRQASDWERYLGDEIGVCLRLWFYYHALPYRRLALDFLSREMAWHKRSLLLLTYSNLRDAMVQRMNINAVTASIAQARVLAALCRLDEALDGRRFLVDDCFSRADLTACALLSPLCLPDDTEASAKFPATVLKLRNELKNRRFYPWVQNVYSSYRAPLAKHASV